MITVPHADIVVFASYLVGHSVVVDRFPDGGQTLTGRDYAKGPGGKGSNQAIQAARMGASVSIIASIGRDSDGDEAMALWEGEGVRTSDVVRSADVPTGVGFIQINAEGENTIVIDLGATGLMTPAFIRANAAAAKGAKIVMAQSEFPAAGALEAMAVGRELGALTILNPAPMDAFLCEADLSNVDLITPNEGEAEALVHGGSVEANGRALAARVRKAAVITAGSDGAYWFLPDGTSGHAPARRVDVVDTTGAGDAFNGILAAGLVRGLPLDEAIRLASQGASLACTKREVIPSLPYHADLMEAAR